MRITSAQSYQTFLQGLQSIQQKLQQAQTEISSGNRINQLSDDPSGAADIVRFTSQKSEIDQYTNNAATGKDRLDFTDSVLGNIQSMVRRAVSVGEAALSDPTSTAVKSSATEIDGLRDQIISTANTNYQGTFLFSGTSNQPAYVKQPDGSVTYQGNANASVLQVGRVSTLQTQIPGSQVFSGSNNVFDDLKQLSAAINSGDKTAIQNQVNALQQYYDSLSVVRSQVGSLSNAAQAAQTDLQSYQLALSSEQSRVQSADMAQAATDFTQAQTALQAATAAGAKISQVSILDYLP